MESVRKLRLAFGLGILVLLPLAACGPTDSKATDGVERHDLGPLVSRVPELAVASEATWYSGTVGDPRVPGPSTYWIDAVVTLPRVVMETILGQYDFAQADVPADLIPELLPEVPNGRLMSSEALNASWSYFPWFVSVYVSEGTDRLVVLIIGGN